MAQSMPSGTNTFIPQMVQDNLLVGFARNVERFALNRYIQVVPTPKNQAYYLKIDGSAAVRLTNTDAKGIVWPDGAKRPTGDNNLAEFEFVPVGTVRKSYEFTVGNLAVEQADWKIVETNAGFQATRAMIARTAAVWNALDDVDWGSNTNTASSISGGYAHEGTADGSGQGFVLKEIFQAAQKQIRLATFGVVRAEDIVCVMTPTVAEALSRSKEVHAYVKESPFALAQIRGDAPSQNGMFGLPDMLYKTRIIVEDAHKVTTKRNTAATKTVAPVGNDNALYFLSRPGGLEFPYGGISYSTVMLFEKEAMSVEANTDAKNRLTEGWVTDDYGAYVVAPASGFEVTALLS
jgi:hypothetical protein